MTVDRGRYSPQSPTLETLRRIGTRASERAHRTKGACAYPGVKNRGITLLLRNHSHPEDTFLRCALTATFWVRYPRGHYL